jgi:hypothetical protein
MSPDQFFPSWGLPSPQTAPYAPGYMPMSVLSAPVAMPSNFFNSMEGSDWASGLAGAQAVNTNPAGFDWGGLFKGFTGSKDAPGWGAPVVGAINGLGSAFMGMQQYGLAKKTFDESRRQFNLNFDAQRSLTNSRLEDRQRARVASNPGAYQSVGDYMNRYGVK